MGFHIGLPSIDLPNPLKALDRAKDAVAERAGAIIEGFKGFLGRVPHYDQTRIDARDPSRNEVRQLRADLDKTLAARGVKYDKSKAPPFDVITYNTAVGNSKIKTEQKDFTRLDFYKKVTSGAPDAPIVNLQEVGADQLKELERLSKTGNFSLVQTSGRDRQSNVMLVPKRFDVRGFEVEKFGKDHLKGSIDMLKAKANGERANPSQFFDLRTMAQVQLRDRLSGKDFTVMNTHLSVEPRIRNYEVDTLVKRINEAKKQGPVILAGDLNTRSNATDRLDGETMRKLEATGLVDMGPNKAPPGKPDIDFVLGVGFKALDSQYRTDLKLPGSPSALSVSDHYCESDLVQFK